MGKEHLNYEQTIPSDERSGDADLLTQLIETHLKILSEKVAGQRAPQELQEEITALNDILYSFKYRAELIAKLLDGATPARQRSDILASLRSMRLTVQQNREQLGELLTKSNDLIRRSASVINRAQEQINRAAHRFSGYAIKRCGLCEGLAGPNHPCPACKNKGSVLVREPATKCPGCDGNGTTNRAAYAATGFSGLCADCKGTGWLSTRPS